ncbi:hypothetical protein BKA69DRAFT_1162866 [Paraphysoderma sedebokerense]|nr:hypothetical protein BKA69DRAFT_1162866 [Paraphysoderma sedebokerense]
MSEKDISNTSLSSLHSPLTAFSSANTSTSSLPALPPLPSGTSNSDPSISSSSLNVGINHWHQRRKLWLSRSPKAYKEVFNEDPPSNRNIDSSSSDNHSSLEIPEKSYIKIYDQLVNQRRPLTKGNRLPLPTLIQIIVAGWKEEGLWQAAETASIFTK